MHPESPLVNDQLETNQQKLCGYCIVTLVTILTKMLDGHIRDKIINSLHYFHTYMQSKIGLIPVELSPAVIFPTQSDLQKLLFSDFKY